MTSYFANKSLMLRRTWFDFLVGWAKTAGVRTQPCHIPCKPRRQLHVLIKHRKTTTDNCKICLCHSWQESFSKSNQYCNKVDPEYWNEFSGTMTLEKQCKVNDFVNSIISTLPENSLYAFTDGSCFDPDYKVGPCGAGVVIIKKERSRREQYVKLKRPVASRGTVKQAELSAVDLMLKYTCRKVDLKFVEKIHIFSDSQLVIRKCMYQENSKGQIQEDVRKIHEKMEKIRLKGTEIFMDWIPARVDLDVKWNKHADTLAKEAALEASKLPLDSNLISEQDVRRARQQFKYLTGDRVARKDYSDNVALAILMKNMQLHDTSKAGRKGKAGDDFSFGEVGLKDRRIKFTGMVQDDLLTAGSKARQYGCIVDDKLSSHTHCLVYGSEDCSETLQEAKKLGVTCVSSESWEKILARNSKVRITETIFRKDGSVVYSSESLVRKKKYFHHRIQKKKTA